MRLLKLALVTLGATAFAFAAHRLDAPEDRGQARDCIPVDQSLLERNSLGLPEKLVVPHIGGRWA